jgi:hypothetical protein
MPCYGATYLQSSSQAHVEVRNEFGLDKYNALDLQKERVKDALPLILGAVLFVAVAAFFTMTNRRAS